MAKELRDPWLVAVWPGMGSVALLAGSHLLQQLGAQQVSELDAEEYFEIQDVEVTGGLIAAGRLPRNMFFQWKDPQGRHDLLIFVGEAQPTSGGHRLCQQVLEYALKRGVKRIFTFAAMATQLQPGGTPRVFAVATDQPSLNMVQSLGAEVLEDGQISGLNGVMLAVGLERGLPGVCMLGELPFFAVGMPNPRAAQAVLERFADLTGISMDYSELEQQAKVVDQHLERMLEQMSQGGQLSDVEEEEGNGGAAPAEPSGAPEKQSLDSKARRRIEHLFARARHDKSKAFELKQELDRLGIFKQYEDRFLDLFRNAD